METIYPFIDGSEYPWLRRAINLYGVEWDNEAKEWYGRASDGISVSLGCDDATAELYLSNRPDPDKW